MIWPIEPWKLALAILVTVGALVWMRRRVV